MIGIVPLAFWIVKLFTGIGNVLLLEPLAVNFSPWVYSLIRSNMVHAAVCRTASSRWCSVEKLAEKGWFVSQSLMRWRLQNICWIVQWWYIARIWFVPAHFHHCFIKKKTNKNITKGFLRILDSILYSSYSFWKQWKFSIILRNAFFVPSLLDSLVFF